MEMASDRGSHNTPWLDRGCMAYTTQQGSVASSEIVALLSRKEFAITTQSALGEPRSDEKGNYAHLLRMRGTVIFSDFPLPFPASK